MAPRPPGGPDHPVCFGKSQFTLARPGATTRLQADHWDTRLRSGESDDAKWEYVRNNPIRAGLVADAGDWPFQGELNELRW